MQVSIKASGRLKSYLPESVVASGKLEVAGNTTLSDIIQKFGINEDEPYVFIVNNAMIPESALSETRVNEGDIIKLIPPIRGG